VGLLTYRIKRREWEISSLKSLIEGEGVGSALIAAVREAAAAWGCMCLRVFTTNDNTRARRLYERRGFSLVAVHRNAVDDARRRLKPGIPLVGNDGVRIRDEIELEMPGRGHRVAVRRSFSSVRLFASTDLKVRPTDHTGAGHAGAKK
jgi:hypothetical protein